MTQMPQPSIDTLVEKAAQFDPPPTGALMSGAMRSGPVLIDHHEARRFPRFRYQSRVDGTIYPFDEGAAPVQCTMLTRDLSRGGINLLHSDALLLGQKIALALTESGPRLVEVMWCRRLAHRCFSIGCRFIKTGDERDGEGDKTEA